MRKIILSLCLLLATLAVQAARLNGIRVETSGNRVVVYIDGQQICTPTTNCFFSTTLGGTFRVEVYSARSARPGERGANGKLLYDQRVYLNGMEIKDIYIEGEGGRFPESSVNKPGRVMERNAFDQFVNAVKAEPFDSDRLKMIEGAMVTNDFTSGQCRKLADLYTFDSDKKKIMKLMYPRIHDKENFFMVIESLTFSSDKNEINDFIKEYHSRRNN